MMKGKCYHISDFTSSFGKKFHIIGNASINQFSRIDSIIDADESSITWVSPFKKDKEALVNNSEGRIFICDESLDFNKLDKKKCCFIVVSNPRLVFARIMQKFYPRKINTFWKERIHPTSIIHPKARIHKTVKIGPYNIIGNCSIDESSSIGSHNFIHDDVIIGKRTIINDYNNLGGDAQGFERDEDNTLIKLPQIGKLIIEDDVEIFSHAIIDKGAMDRTWIKRGVKIGNYVYIAHNSLVGNDTIIIAHSVICGSCSIGKNVWIGVGCSIKDGITIGKNVLIGIGSVVTKNVPDHETWIGNPAMEINKFKNKRKR